MKKLLIICLAGISGILTTACQEKKTEKITVNWATFNIRYDNPADSLNNWKYRKDTVAAFIKANQLDIVGMQEVLHNQLEDLKQRLPEYAEVGVGREDGKTQGEYAPLFYRKDRFEALDSNTFWLSQYPDSVGFIGWDGACTRIATWAKLKDRKTGKIFMENSDTSTNWNNVTILPNRAKTPSQTFILADTLRSVLAGSNAGKQFYAFFPGQIAENSGVGLSHNKRANCGFIDGHVEPMSKEEMKESPTNLTVYVDSDLTEKMQ